MRRADVAPTKSNLLRLKEDHGFVRAGHDLLDRKREILVEELLDAHRDAAQARREVERGLAELYAALRAAALAGGTEAVAAEALAAPPAPELGLRERSVMGVVVPLLELRAGEAAEPRAAEPLAAPGWAAPAVAEVGRQARALLEPLVRLAEIEATCRRLAAELRRTQRRVNALENVFLPEARDTIRFIEGSLEEREREGLFQLKRLKSRTARAERGDRGERGND